MSEQDALIERYGAIVKKAARWGVSKTHLEYDDLYQYAVERLLVYGTGEGWSHSDKLRSTDGSDVNRFVMRTLQGDLLDYLDMDRRQRNLDTFLSTDQIVDERTEIQKGAWYMLNDPSALKRTGTGLLSGLVGRDTQWADLLYERFPLLMANTDGMSERDIADSVNLTRDQVHARIIKERGAFVRMVNAGEFPMIPPDFYSLLDTGELVFKVTCPLSVNGKRHNDGECSSCDALSLAADIDSLNQRIPERSFTLEIREEWLDDYQPCSEAYAERRLAEMKGVNDK